MSKLCMNRKLTSEPSPTTPAKIRLPSGTAGISTADAVISIAVIAHNSSIRSESPNGANPAIGTTQTSALAADSIVCFLTSSRDRRRRSASASEVLAE